MIQYQQPSSDIISTIFHFPLRYPFTSNPDIPSPSLCRLEANPPKTCHSSQLINSQYIMEKERVEEQEEYESSNASRASTIGHQTSHHEHTESLIHEMVHYHGLDLITFLKTCEQHPHIKDETALIQQIFQRREFVIDLIGFLAAPERTFAKYGLGLAEGGRLMATVRDFLHENYEFLEYLFLAVEEGELGHEIWFDFLQNRVNQIYYSSLGDLADLFLPFVKYEFSTSSRVTEYFEKKYSNERNILVISQFDEALISKLLRFTQFEAIFKILYHLVLASLQEQEWKMSLNLLKLLCQSAIDEEGTRDSHIENVHMMLRDVSNNIEKDIHNTIFAFTDAFVQSNLVEASINRTKLLLTRHLNEQEFETALEFNLKVMAEIVNIYYLLRRINIDYMATQMVKLRTSILQIFNSLDNFMILMRNVQSRPLKFSNGENVRLSYLFRYQFLNLLRLCLTIVKEYGEACPELQTKIDKSLILEFIINCLSENRWNNIIHCQIEKVIYLSIGPECFKSKNLSIQRFLRFLVETFSNKKYIFLNSTKMINQGDIHSLYFISRKITVELDRTPGIVDISNQYDFWKQFVVNVLQKYQNNNERLSKISSELDYEANDKYDGDLKVEIDELASIKEIVKKVDINQKWTKQKENQNGHSITRVSSASSLNKGKLPKQKSQKVGSPIAQKTAVRIRVSQSEELKLEEVPETNVRKKSYKKVTSLTSNIEEPDLKYGLVSHSDSEAADEEEILKKIQAKI